MWVNSEHTHNDTRNSIGILAVFFGRLRTWWRSVRPVMAGLSGRFEFR